MAQSATMFNISRERAPFWLVDVIALVGIILFVVLNKLQVEWGLGVILVILGYGQSHRALAAANTGGSIPPPSTTAAAMPPAASGVLALFMSAASLLRPA